LGRLKIIKLTEYLSINMNKDTVSFGRIRVAAKKVTHFETPPYGNGMELSALFWRLKCGPRTIWSYTLKMKKRLRMDRRHHKSDQ
jgi:hypothetical protein